MSKYAIPTLRGGLWCLLSLISCLGWLSSAAIAASNDVSTSCKTPDSNATITTCFFDLTASPSSTQTPKSAVLNGGIFRVPAYNDELGHGFIVGTGHWDPFVRIQEHGNGNNN